MNDNTVYSYINDIAQRLKEPRKYGDVSLMIGAGFSKNAQSKGMASMQPPNWSELAEKMYEELYPEPLEVQEKEEWNKQRIIKTSGKNVTKLADEYIANFDRNKINNLIEQSIADEMFVPGELHKRLLNLHWSDIFTTNYDTLLEQTVDMIYPIIRDDLPERELLVSAAELKEAMQQKVREERRVPRQIVKKKPTNSAILEIDLHITELLDNTNGLSNADMLTYQLGKFREVMDQYALNNGQKIVFIHGKGDGVLRKAIEKDLKTRYKQHYFQDASFREYGFGATMVTIKADTSQHGH